MCKHQLNCNIIIWCVNDNREVVVVVTAGRGGESGRARQCIIQLIRIDFRESSGQSKVWLVADSGSMANWSTAQSAQLSFYHLYHYYR